jgi:hypothetical protein
MAGADCSSEKCSKHSSWIKDEPWQKPVLLFHSPGGANAKIGKLRILVCGIPGLNFLVESLQLFIGAVGIRTDA